MIASLIAVAAILLNWLPQWINSVWGLYSPEPLIPWLHKQHISTFGFSPSWITWPVSSIILVGIFWMLWSDRNYKKPWVSSTQEQPGDGVYQHIMEAVTKADPERNKADHERLEKRRKATQQCLETYASIHDQSHLMAASLIKAGAHKLDNNYQLVEICKRLQEYGHLNPLDYWREYVPDDDALEFLKKVAYSPARLTDDAHGAGVLHEAMVKWRKDHNYPEPSMEQKMDAITNKAWFPSVVSPVEPTTDKQNRVIGEIMETISARLNVVKKMVRACNDPKQIPPLENVTNWERETAIFLRDKLGKTAENFFTSEVGVPPEPPCRYVPERADLLRLLHHRSYQLNRIFEALLSNPRAFS